MPDLSTPIPPLRRVRRVLVLAALCALALFLRVRSIDYGLPHREVYDEVYFQVDLGLVREGSPEARAHELYGTYPQLVVRIASWLAPDPVEPRPAPLERHLELASRDLVLMRAIAAAC